MKTKEEEKQIRGNIERITQQVKKNRPELLGLLDDAENYVKHLQGR